MPRNKKEKGAKRKATAPKPSQKTERKARRSKKTTKAATKRRVVEPTATAAGSNRAEGIRLFNLAGRPNKQQFQLVYGERGHLMTWPQRAQAGVPAEKFQAALAEKGKQ